MENNPPPYTLIFKRNNYNFEVDYAETVGEAFDLLEFYKTLVSHMGLRILTDVWPGFYVYTNDHEELGEYYIKED